MRVLRLLTVILVLLVPLLIQKSEGASHTMDNVLDFFPESEGDGLNIIWAHGVNSHEDLNQSLHDDTMMLETDIILRGIGTENQTDIPVNAHPPDTDSDLLTLDFINKTTLTSGKGMKLDFKYLEAVGPTMEIVLDLDSQINCPLWINADIVKGPNSPKDPISPVEFIDTANSYFNETVMSLGFTTDWGVFKEEDMYTWTMIFDILQYTYNLDPQPVTYPIRAIWCVRSWSKFTWLLGLRESFSITVWTASTDPVDIQGLMSLREHGDIKRIFYDLPTSMRDNFLQAIETGVPAPDEKQTSLWNRESWTSVSAGGKNLVFLSTESAGISGPSFRAGYIQSIEQHKPKSGALTVTVQGIVQFVDRYDEPSNEAIAEIFIRTAELDSSNSEIFSEGYMPPSIGLFISQNGEVRLVSDSSVEVSDQLPSAECFSFKITDSGEGEQIESTVSVVTCGDANLEDPNAGRNCTLTLSAEETLDVGDQSFVVLSKRDGSGDVIVENLTVIEADSGSEITLPNVIMLILSVFAHVFKS